MTDHKALPLPMPDFTVFQASARLRAGLRLSVLAGACAVLLACSAVDSTTNKVVNAFTPYRIDVVQGNVVTREQVAVLRPGMSRLQVRDVLGTPLLTSMFHADRWDYVFTFVRQGQAPQSRKVAVFFKGEVLERFEADTLPSEAEFVASLDAGIKRKAALLEASSDKLEKFPAPVKAAPSESAKPLPPLPTTYPPLEPAQR
jgi:outer membrane protein assembly factor BamE